LGKPGGSREGGEVDGGGIEAGNVRSRRSAKGRAAGLPLGVFEPGLPPPDGGSTDGGGIEGGFNTAQASDSIFASATSAGLTSPDRAIAMTSLCAANCRAAASAGDKESTNLVIPMSPPCGRRGDAVPGGARGAAREAASASSPLLPAACSWSGGAAAEAVAVTAVTGVTAWLPHLPSSFMAATSSGPAGAGCS